VDAVWTTSAFAAGMALGLVVMGAAVRLAIRMVRRAREEDQ
jgi:hypothetical protein